MCGLWRLRRHVLKPRISPQRRSPRMYGQGESQSRQTELVRPKCVSMLDRVTGAGIRLREDRRSMRHDALRDYRAGNPRTPGVWRIRGGRPPRPAV